MRSTGKLMTLMTVVILVLLFSSIWILKFGLNLPTDQNAVILLNEEGWWLVLVGVLATFVSVASLFLEVRSSTPLAFVGWAFYLPTLFNVLVPMFVVFFSIVGIFYTPWLAFIDLPSANRLINGVIIIHDEGAKLAVDYIGYLLFLSGLAIYMISLYQLLSHTAKQHQLFIGGLYKFVRHPQYFGIILWTLGFAIIGWRPINYMMWVFLSYSYVLLAENEEIDLVKAYGSRYERYRESVPSMIPFPFSIAFKPFGRRLSSFRLKAVSYTLFFLVLAAVLYLWLDQYIVLYR